MSAMTSGSAGFKIYGEAYSVCGYNVHGIGDMNGDGFDDIWFSCYYAQTVYVIFGKRTGFADVDLAGLTSGDSRGFVIVGTSGSAFGASGGAIGDYNNDGYDDIIIGAASEVISGRSSCGAAFVMLGHSNATSFLSKTAADITSGAQGFRIYGAASNALCTADSTGFYGGDFNGDGVDDFVLSK